MSNVDVVLIVDPECASADWEIDLDHVGCRLVRVVDVDALGTVDSNADRAAILVVAAPPLASIQKWIRDVRRVDASRGLCVLIDGADPRLLVESLDSGADLAFDADVDPLYLSAQLHALARRMAAGRGTHDLRIYPEAREVHLDGSPLGLTDSEYDLLDLLFRHRGRIVDRATIKRALRGLPHDFGDRSIDLLMVRLRRKLRDDPRNPRHIRTVRGEGYMLMSPIPHSGSVRA